MATAATSTPSASLTQPADHLCPRCGIHNRAMDNYNGCPPFIIADLCPVCADDDRGR